VFCIHECEYKQLSSGGGAAMRAQFFYFILVFIIIVYQAAPLRCVRKFDVRQGALVGEYRVGPAGFFYFLF
jgi:hypothetical protein